MSCQARVVQVARRDRLGVGSSALPVRELMYSPSRPNGHCVVVGLRRPARVQAIGGDFAAIAEELHLPRRAVARQEVVAVPTLVADAGGEAEAQARTSAFAVVLQRLARTRARRLRIRCRDWCVEPSRPSTRAVEHADRVAERAAGEFALQLHADSRAPAPVRWAGRVRSSARALLDCRCSRPTGCLELAEAHGRARIEPQVEVGVVDGGAVAGELRLTRKPSSGPRCLRCVGSTRRNRKPSFCGFCSSSK